MFEKVNVIVDSECLFKVTHSDHWKLYSNRVLELLDGRIEKDTRLEVEAAHLLYS